MLNCVHYLRRVRLEDGGVVRAVLDFCQSFASVGHATTLVTCEATDVPVAWSQPNVTGVPKVVTIDPPRGLLNLWQSAAKRQFASAIQGADVLHLHGMWETSNAQAAAIARRAGIPYLLSPHGMLDDWSMSQRPWKKRAYLAVTGNRVLKEAARVHFTAQGELDQGAKWVPAGKGRVVPLIVDLSAFAELPGPGLARDKFPGLRTGRPTMLFLSRVHPKKGVEVLIDAADLLVRRGLQYKFLIAGPGDPEYIRHLRSLIDGRALRDQFEFLGMVRGAEKISLLQAADALILPTSQENFGLALIEALACAANVITTRAVDIWKELQQAGATIVDRDARSVADAVVGLPPNPPPNLVGREWVMRNLNPTRLSERYARLYREVSSG